MFLEKEQADFFQQLIDKTIAESFSKTRGLKVGYYVLTISALLLSALLTVILGYHSIDDQEVFLHKNLAVILGSIITFLTGLNTFWRLDRFWIKRRIFVRKLINLRDRFNYQRLSVAEYDLSLLFTEYQNLQDNQTLYWEDVYKEVTADRNKDQQEKKVG